jgi:hypothetical protein
MEEKRLFPRVALSGMVEFLHQGTDHKGTASLADVSRGGAKLQTPKPLSVDSVISMRIELLDNHKQPVVEAIIGRVVRCSPEAGGSYAVGVQFIQPVNPKKAPFLYAYVD